ncbi:hypothetical protein P691DRAFT_768040 [Macrolepiota fuliginosa MF-IS2]|uniref:Uncharacterized protein n=1 Tax=Macrolepiota fuliginosa MF-IS2 TaxID=1400762 RepID=A0A9P5WXG4_9AGAR|nr:hypothetical protein P691DRAFT_768040 [Macrolepiota fuliginosa MF-IS2]
MPCKAKNKPATNAMPTYKLSATTEQFFTVMDQNHRITSQFTTQELMKIGGFDWAEIRDDLLRMNFTEVDTSTPDNSTAIEVDNNDNALSYKELSPAEDLTNAIAAFGQWFENNIRCLTMMFSLIPALHHCPNPPPCTHPHQDDALPCRCLHANDIPPPPLEAASQAPAPSHKASMPPPPPTATATLPAAVASIPKPGPKPRPSYAGAVVKNLDPAAPPFMHGPP